MYNLATLRYGDKGPLTELLQLALTRAGFSPGNIDGIFGSKTLDAVKSFQASAGLTRDGIVGKNTWRLLIPYLRGYAVHTIKPRDTLYSIANSYKTTIRAIETANPGINPMNLQVGSRIIVPYSFKVVPSNVQFTSLLMDFIADGLTARYPFIKSRSIGNSKIGRALYCFSIGTGTDQVF